MYKQKEGINFDLIENGLDFATSGIEHILNDNSPNSLKYAVLHLAAGIELILKDTLQKEHWSLIFDNPNKATYATLTSGEFKSVDFENLLLRLGNICEIELNQEDIHTLQQFKKLRNKIEHFEFRESIPAIKSVSSKVLSFLLDYINDNLALEKLSDISKGYIEKLKTLSFRFNEFIELRNFHIAKELNKIRKEFKIEICPTCRQGALVLTDDRLCAFCGYTDSPKNIARLYVENILGENYTSCIQDGGDFPVVECIHCGTDTFVNKGNDYICFNCFETNNISELKGCSTCGQLFEDRKDEMEICDNCIDIRISERD